MKTKRRMGVVTLIQPGMKPSIVSPRYSHGELVNPVRRQIEPDASGWHPRSQFALSQRKLSGPARKEVRSALRTMEPDGNGYCCPRCHTRWGSPMSRAVCRRSHHSVPVKLEVA